MPHLPLAVAHWVQQALVFINNMWMGRRDPIQGLWWLGLGLSGAVLGCFASLKGCMWAMVCSTTVTDQQGIGGPNFALPVGKYTT
mmetsp:Transcript_48755/g.86794  ORF Transcript_48755/g.86794 Transcript_48755/m.86794 type:complete len:85 (-) Transcript_48755:2587-2841(-)